VILADEIYDQAVEQFRRLHAYLATPAEKEQLERFLFPVEGAAGGAGENCAQVRINAAAVGRSPAWIAEQAGFEVPADTSIILAEIDGVGAHQPLSREKLCPVLAVLRADSREHGFALAEQMVELDGLGHSAVIHTTDAEAAQAYGLTVKAVRIIWNAPSSHGGIGDIYNALTPSLTLG